MNSVDAYITTSHGSHYRYEKFVFYKVNDCSQGKNATPTHQELMALAISPYSHMIYSDVI